MTSNEQLGLPPLTDTAQASRCVTAAAVLVILEQDAPALSKRDILARLANAVALLEPERVPAIAERIATLRGTGD
jgi:hypothetical protein